MLPSLCPFSRGAISLLEKKKKRAASVCLITMEKKLERYGVKHLLTAGVNLSQFAMVSSVPPTEPVTSTSKYLNDLSTIEKYNWLLHIMYGRGESDRLQQFIGVHPHKSTYMTYVQALSHRQEGRINEALDGFQRCVVDEPSLLHIKQVGKSLALLGRHRMAIEAYQEALGRTTNDWEVFHNLGLCYFHLNDLNEAKKYFLQAIQVSEMQEASYLSLGEIYLRENERGEAEAVFKRGASRNPESPTLFTKIGLLAFEVTARFRLEHAQRMICASRKRITPKPSNVSAMP